jgi:hypothetical protein
MKPTAKYVNIALISLLAMTGCTTLGIALFSFTNQPADPTSTIDPMRHRDSSVSTNIPTADTEPASKADTGAPIPNRLSAEASSHLTHQFTNDTYGLRIETDQIDKDDSLKAGVALEHTSGRKGSGYKFDPEEGVFSPAEEDETYKLQLKKKF